MLADLLCINNCPGEISIDFDLHHLPMRRRCLFLTVSLMLSVLIVITNWIMSE